jgi:Protein of unknown function (DUF3224)
VHAALRRFYEFLQAAHADGSASFVGIERVTGTVAGRTGTFLLQDAGTVQDNIVSGDWFAIPGSGTGGIDEDPNPGHGNCGSDSCREGHGSRRDSRRPFQARSRVAPAT